MSFSYSGNPSISLADEVRFLLHDTVGTSVQYSDEEIAFLLSSNNNSALRAAIAGAEYLAARYAGEAQEKRVGPLLIANRNTTTSDEYRKLAQILRGRLGRAVAPYAGGVSEEDKTSRATESDRIHPFFSRGMIRYPDAGTPTENADPGVLLSPPEGA